MMRRIVNSLFIGTSNQLGEFESGVTAAWLGVVPSVVAGGIGTLVVVVLWMRLFPSLANIDLAGRPRERHRSRAEVAIAKARLNALRVDRRGA